jgi:hypothetical protein
VSQQATCVDAGAERTGNGALLYCWDVCVCVWGGGSGVGAVMEMMS